MLSRVLQVVHHSQTDRSNVTNTERHQNNLRVKNRPFFALRASDIETPLCGLRFSPLPLSPRVVFGPPSASAAPAISSPRPSHQPSPSRLIGPLPLLSACLALSSPRPSPFAFGVPRPLPGPRHLLSPALSLCVLRASPSRPSGLVPLDSPALPLSSLRTSSLSSLRLPPSPFCRPFPFPFSVPLPLVSPALSPSKTVPTRRFLER